MSPDRRPKTILLAEDEWPVRDFVLALLQENGYSVIVAVDGLDALEKAREYIGEIHLLLSDIQMPRVTGIKLATQLLLERPKMEVLLMSGTDAGMLVLDSTWQFLPKPFVSQLLLEKIEMMLKDLPTLGRDPSDFGKPAEYS